MPRAIVDLTEPLALAAALDAFAEYAANRRDLVPTTSEKAIRSTAVDAVRHWRLKGNPPGATLPKAELFATDIRPVLKDLAVYATESAKAKRHLKPSDHGHRAQRFVTALTGKGGRGRNVEFAVSEHWQPLVKADGRSGAASAIYMLERCCEYLGAFRDAPARLPGYEQFLEAGRALGLAESSLRTGMSRYRQALTQARESYPDRAFAPLPKGRIGHATHLGTEPDTLEALREAGVPDVELLSPRELLAHLAPELVADIEYALTDCDSAEFSDSWKEQVWQALARVVGWMIRDGRLVECATFHLIDLFERDVSTGPRTMNPRYAKVARAGAPHEGGSGDKPMPTVISLLEHLVEQEAPASVQRSPVVSAVFKADTARWAALPLSARREQVKFTQSLYGTCMRIGSVMEDLYAGMKDSEPARWGMVMSRWLDLKGRLTEHEIPEEHLVYVKDKAKLIKTVTRPQLVCVAMPYRLRRIRRLRAAWATTRRIAREKGFVHPDEHPAVVSAAEDYFGLAVPFLMLACAVDDGLRKQQYQEGRAGAHRNFRFEFTRDAHGRPVGIAKVTTWWSGDKTDPAHLKVRKVRRGKGRGRQKKQLKREDRDIRPGIVPLDLLWDFMSYWRPRTLAHNRAVVSLEEYDLDADMRDGRWALFPSPVTGVARRRPHRSRTDFEQQVSVLLYDMVRECLRPELPEWGALGPEWRSLWTQHIFRLLISSYHGGVRDDWTTACYLTQDTEETLRSEYTEIDAATRDKLLLSHDHWEHPNAHDVWMDRLFGAREVFDPLADSALPLPPHLQVRLEAERIAEVATRGRRGRRQEGPRVRRPRAGQPAPGIRAA